MRGFTHGGQTEDEQRRFAGCTIPIAPAARKTRMHSFGKLLTQGATKAFVLNAKASKLLGHCICKHIWRRRQPPERIWQARHSVRLSHMTEARNEAPIRCDYSGRHFRAPNL